MRSWRAASLSLFWVLSSERPAHERLRARALSSVNERVHTAEH